MEFTGWAPLDLVVGGMLTAGMAFGVYKCGRFGKRKTTRSAAEMDARRLDACMALTRGASEMDMAGFFEPDARCRQLARSLQLSMEKARASRSSGGNNTVRATASGSSAGSSSAARVSRAASGDSSDPDLSVGTRTWEEDTRNLASDRELSDIDKPSTSYARSSYAFTTQPDPNEASTSTPHQDAYVNSDDLPKEVPPELDDSIPIPPELRRKIEIYRENVGKRVNEMFTAMEARCRSLATELREEREALDVARKERAEAEQSAQRTEAYVQEAKERLERMKRQDEADVRQEEKIKNLLRQVEELEEQLDLLYRNNIVTTRSAAQEHAQEQEEAREQLEQLKIKVSHDQELLHDMETEIAVLNGEISNLRGGMKTQIQENLELQRYLHSACRSSRVMIGDVLQRVVETEDCQLGELMDILNVPDVALPITPALEVTINVLRRQMH